MLHYVCYIMCVTLCVLHYVHYIMCVTLCALHYVCYVMCITLCVLHNVCYIMCVTLCALHYVCYIVCITLCVLHSMLCVCGWIIYLLSEWVSHILVSMVRLTPTKLSHCPLNSVYAVTELNTLKFLSFCGSLT